jgi:hypothetical protein
VVGVKGHTPYSLRVIKKVLLDGIKSPPQGQNVTTRGFLAGNTKKTVKNRKETEKLEQTLKVC